VVATGAKTRIWGAKAKRLMTIAPDGRSFTIMVPTSEDAAERQRLNAPSSGESQTTDHRELAASPSRSGAQLQDRR